MSKLTLLPATALAVLALGLTSSASAADAAKPANPAATPAKARAQSGFVTVKGRHFVIDGKPYYFAGANLWYGMYLGAPRNGDRPRLTKELDDLAAHGITNLRVLAVSEASDLKRAVRPAVLLRPGHIDETLWQGLDFLLTEMAKRDMKAVLYLNNFWQWSGGMSQYVAWFGGKPVSQIDPDVTGNWNVFTDNSASFYRTPKANEAFKFVVEQLVRRRNSINGRAYAEDPTIMSWQLANEPRPGSDPGGAAQADAFVTWIAETSKFIKELAPKQLVSTGNEGWMGTAGDRKLFVTAHRTAHVDYLTFHMWAPNWSWYDPKNAAATYEGAWKKAEDYLNWHIDAANGLGKPIVLEEFGLNRDDGSYRPDSKTTFRDQYYGAIFGLVARRAAAGDAIAGSNFWAWGGAGRTKNADFMWKPGDAFVGDPPQEAQGLYCVFDSDRSTIDIIAAHARQLRRVP